MKNLKVGIAGYGVVGKRRANCIDAHPNLKLIAICDKNPEEKEYLTEDVKYYQSYQELLEEELDVLFVSMSNDMAAEVTKAGLNIILSVILCIVGCWLGMSITRQL